MKLGWRLWCFSEARMYTPYDVYKIFIKNIDTKKLAIKILEKFPEEIRDKLIKESGQELELTESPFTPTLIEFKKHSINYEDLKIKILDILEKGEE